MVWEIETECDPGEGAHSWGKKDMVGDVTCLATYRCSIMFNSNNNTIMFLLPLEDTLSTVGECSQAKSRRKRGWQLLFFLSHISEKLSSGCWLDYHPPS